MGFDVASTTKLNLFLEKMDTKSFATKEKMAFTNSLTKGEIDSIAADHIIRSS